MLAACPDAQKGNYDSEKDIQVDLELVQDFLLLAKTGHFWLGERILSYLLLLLCHLLKVLIVFQ